MRDELKDNFGIEATNKQLWKARQKARGDVGGGYVHSYANLRQYAIMVHNTNPRNAAIVQSQLVSIMSEEEGRMQPQFKRIFICYEGVKKSWHWFLEKLIEEIGETANGHPWCIMSDRQKGLIEAVAAIPNAEHRYCCFYIENNMIKKFGTSQLRGMFWAAVKTTNLDNFKHIMVMIKQFNIEAHEWLSNIDFGHWTLSKFDTRAKVEHLTNNFVESFNDWIEEHRYKPPIELLEGLRIQHAEMLCTWKEVAERLEQKLTPSVHLKVNELLKKGQLAHVTRVGQEEFQVDYDKKRCIVKLNEWYCICGQWKVRGIPCIHAGACINKMRVNIEDYCSTYFTIEMWRKILHGVIHPIPDESMWPQFDDENLLPPIIKAKVPSIRDSQQPFQRVLIIHESSPESCSKSSDSSVPPTPPANTTMTQSDNEVHNEEKSVTCSLKQSESHIEKTPQLKPILEENEHFECKIGVKSKMDDVTKLINDEADCDRESEMWFVVNEVPI
ncbi:uncharacterized protein LOC133824408 [Humulus lupulus]|uniref:uncharacterized protein LOC133824408 n=1 Tax=Humulus lupulus TaxID=3486 RepID=UPI002B4064BA|nr:uncharacterized protein LOC133824408 [Humulus lupulus]